MIQSFTILCTLLFHLGLSAQPVNKIQSTLDSLQKAGNYPGLSLAIVYADNTRLALTAGYNDIEQGLVLKPSDLLLMGSVGKTYVAAVAMKLIQQKKLSLADPVSKYLGHFSWYNRIPNAKEVTVRMIMNHTSGIMRYEFKEAFTKALTANPDKAWKPEELLEYVLDEKATFHAGAGWEYSDTNYILLGMIIEKITGKAFYKILQEEMLAPLQLKQTFPSDRRKLKGLAQGYAGDKTNLAAKIKLWMSRENF